MNIYDITKSQDPTKTYCKTFDEKKYNSINEWFDKVSAYERKLEIGIFAHSGNFYFTEFKRIDQTEREHDPIVGMTTTVNRVVKFVWKYRFLK